MGSVTWTSNHQGWYSYSYHQMSSLLPTETNYKALIWSHSSRNRPDTWWQADDIGSFPPEKNSGIYSGCGFIFPRTSACTAIKKLIECLIHWIGILYNTHLIYKLTLHQWFSKCGSWTNSIIGKDIRNVNFWIPPKNFHKTVVGPRSRCFNKPFIWF